MPPVLRSSAPDPPPPDVSLPERVRQTCGRVAAVAGLVRIDTARIDAYAAELSDESGLADPTPPAAWLEGRLEQRAGLVLALSTINYGSGWHPVLAKRAGLSGARTVAAGFTEWWTDRGGATPAEVADLGTVRLAGILGQEADGPAADLMARFAAGLRDLGDWVEATFGGSWLAVGDAARGSAARLAAMLAGLPQWDDRASHPDAGEVWLFKRAQIAAADLAEAGAASFADLDSLTAMADNLVPHVLRIDGVVLVDPALVATIERGELLPPGSRGEVELRAVAVEAVERLVARLAEQGHPSTAAELDRRLWWRGRLDRYKSRARHRTRCTWY